MRSYLYRHIKPDGETFYIGIAKASKRIKSKDNRNKYWHHIVNKYGFESQILKTGLTWEEACELEKILISFYGRRDLGTGSLVNMTDGGDGCLGIKYKTGSQHHHSKLVMDTTNGVFYETITEASKIYNIPKNTLTQYLRGERKNKTNLILV